MGPLASNIHRITGPSTWSHLDEVRDDHEHHADGHGHHHVIHEVGVGHERQPAGERHHGRLLAPVQEEARAGNYQEVEALASELAQNMQKITHHGQRASGIVRALRPEHHRQGREQTVCLRMR